MSALGEYYRGMGAAAMDQARASHESAAAQQTGANAQMVGAEGQAALHHAQASMVEPLATSEIGLQGHQGSNLEMTGQAALTNAAANMMQSNTGAAVGGAQIRQMDRGSGNFATGTSRVSAPGDGTVDTTKARLANGEAVLNKGAAEHLGQPAIQALNAVGMLRMGMVPGQNTQAPQASGPGYAKGTSKAGPKKAAKTDAKPAAKDDKPAAKDAKSASKNDKSGGGKPSDTPPIDQIDPKMLAAAMQMGLMGQQGGGMPPPGGAPQQMPQGAPMGMM
jgi:hypothetical protein